MMKLTCLILIVLLVIFAPGVDAEERRRRHGRHRRGRDRRGRDRHGRDRRGRDRRGRDRPDGDRPGRDRPGPPKKEPCQIKHLGCWKEREARAVPVLLGEHEYGKNLEGAKKKCAAATKAKGWKVFVLHDLEYCYSGPNAHNEYKRYGTTTECRKRGQPGYGMGNSW